MGRRIAGWWRARREGAGDGQRADPAPERRWPTREEVVVEFVVGLFVTAFFAKVADEWSTATWIGLGLTIATVIAAIVILRNRRSRLTALTVSVAVLVGALVAFVVFRPDPEPDPPRMDACERTPPASALDVMVVWQESELEAFCDVVAGYDAEVEVTSTGEDIGTALGEDLDGRDVPDVAIIPQPTLVRHYATQGDLCATPQEVADRFPRQWNELVTYQVGGSGPRQVFGAVVKGSHKSLFWYDLDALGAEDPGDWSWRDLVTWITGNVDSGTFEAPLAVPAGSRWSVTDWFENQLAGTDPDLYRRLAEADPVEWRDEPSIRQALTDMAQLWRASGVLAGGPEGAAATSWSDLPRQISEGDAALGFGPSFVAGAGDELPRNHRLWVAGFPALPEGNPLIVGGDFAVVPAASGDCTAGAAFVRWLTGEEAMERWSERDSGFLTPNAESPYAIDEPVRRGEWEDVRILLTTLIRPGPDDLLHFDLSDGQFSAANGGDPRGAWDVLERFFEDVTSDPSDLECALDRAIDGLEAEYRGEPAPDPGC